MSSFLGFNLQLFFFPFGFDDGDELKIRVCLLYIFFCTTIEMRGEVLFFFLLYITITSRVYQRIKRVFRIGTK